MINIFKKRTKLASDDQQLKYYCSKCNKELTFEMYESKKCFWCDSKNKNPIVVKEIDKTPTSISELNRVIIDGNYNSLLKFYKQKEEILNDSKKQKNSKKNN